LAATAASTAGFDAVALMLSALAPVMAALSLRYARFYLWENKRERVLRDHQFLVGRDD
jgi:hypothetical protein